MRFFQKGLTRRYFLVAFAILLISLTVVLAVADYFSRNALRQEINHRNELLNKTLSARFNWMLKDVLDDLMIYEIRPVGFEDRSAAMIRKEMENIIATKPWYLFIQYFDEKGNLQERVPGVSFYDQELAVESIVERIRWSKAPYITNLYVLPDGRKTLSVATPYSRTSADFEGGFIAFLNLEVFSDYLYQSRLGQDGFGFLVDGNGYVIAHTDKSRIGQNIGEPRLQDNIWKARYGIFEGRIFNQQVIASYYPLSFGNIGLVVGEPEKQAFATASRLSLLLIKCFLLILFGAVCFVYYGTVRVVKPIVGLTDQVKKYSRGEIINIERVETGDEIAVLSETLHRLATKLINNEKSLQQILESIPYAVITTDEKGTIRSFNRGAEKLLLYPREEVTGASLRKLQLGEACHNLIIQTFEEGQTINEVESYLCDHQGERHDVRLYCAPLHNQEAYHNGAIIVIRDVSELKKLQQYLYQSERLAALGQLTAGIAHEIKNPLNIIIAATESLQRRGKRAKDAVDEYALELQSTILETAHRMNGILHDFLQLSSEKPEKRDPLDLKMILADLLRKLRTTFTEKGITVETRYQTGSAMVEGERNQLSQALLNIILNSVQAMEKGGTLMVEINDLGREWELVIADNGKGIEKAHLPRIFNPFFSTKQTGTGLGLAIVHEIITKHNGRVAVTSEINQGTSLQCVFPKYDQEEGGNADENPADGR